ncbi:MAG: histidine phosphatase family protein [Gammaproteobacteria bacterium]
MGEQYRIWLVRHGETAWSLSGQHTGRTDIPLTATGRCQAETLGRYFAGRSFALVLTSPLGRAVETCRLAGYDAVAQRNDDLLEWDYGIYEGKTTAAIRQQQPDWSIWNSSIVDGESVAQVGERARRVIRLAESAKGDTLLFAHAHLLRILGACWIGRPPSDGRLLKLDTASISVLGWEHENHVIDVWNQDWHLVPIPVC